MFKTSFQIAKLFGIPIRVDVSLIVLMALIWFDTLGTGIGPLWSFILGGAFALLLLLSITLHELGHSLVSMRFGCRVRAITLLLLGGRAELSHLPTRPVHEFLIAIAGPLVSLALWLGGSYGAAWLSVHTSEGTGCIFACYLLAKLGILNACLFWFNLIPAFPMDGGRVLRAMLAHRMGRLQATRIAATIGRGLAVATLVWILMPGPKVIQIDAHTWQIARHAWTFGPFNMGFDRFMLGLIALFIFQAAGQEYQLVQVEAFYQSNNRRPPGMPPPPPDQAIVSPPPYRHERRDRADIERDNGQPRV